MVKHIEGPWHVAPENKAQSPWRLSNMPMARALHRPQVCALDRGQGR